MEQPNTTFAELGSINAFAEQQGIDPADPQLLVEYSSELASRRLTVAAEIGIRVDDLHSLTVEAGPSKQLTQSL
jgi:hypothetical protein